MALIVPGQSTDRSLAELVARARARPGELSYASTGNGSTNQLAAEHFAAERKREEEETEIYPDRERWEVAAILHRYGVRGDALRMAVDSICADKRRWVDFMMRFELDLKEPQPDRAARSAVTIGGAYVVGGLLPLSPYILLDSTHQALVISACITGVALAGFGWLKAKATGLPATRGAVQTLFIGGLAASVAYMVAKLVGG
jgi:VIT1/CCC1 family predicted Fe2+/Mn2+ transporter